MAEKLSTPKRPTGNQICNILGDLGQVVLSVPPPETSLAWARLQGFHAGLCGADLDPGYDEKPQRHYVRGYRVGYWLRLPPPGEPTP